ncbi:MAG: GTPase domain-containing protein [Dehalococcoidia bacterium]|nr:GTPase domain-containing protein [Dehalococcoidia bacterium]
MTETNWHDAILDTLRRLVGAEQTANVLAAWHEHASRTRPEVTLLGPYSAGKSTLLRRLVVDSETPIPDWLTVSARRETFELNAIDVGGLTFTDAPGFAAGSEMHDALAEDALALSDAFLLVVPPQLLTTGRDLVGSILSGAYFFGAPRLGNERIVIAVIAQADSMGIDPDDDLEGMQRLATRKRSELIAQLEASAEVSLGQLQVFCVAADPYEAQARRPDPPRAAFDPYRSWDGIDALTRALDALPARHAELQHAAGVRYFCRVAIEVAAKVRIVVDDLEATAGELRARHTMWSQQRTRVEAVVDAARSDLHSTLISMSEALSEQLGADGEESRRLIDDRLAATVEQWSRKWDGEIDLVLGEAAAQNDERLNRPRATRTDEFVRSLTTQPGRIDAESTTSRIVGLLNDVKGEFDNIARAALELCTGGTLEVLLAAGKSTVAKSADGAAPLNAAGEKAAKVAQRVAAGLQLADAVMTVVNVVETERRQFALDAQRRREREEARDRIDSNSETLSREIVDGTPSAPGWRARADVTLVLLRQQLGLTGDGAAIDDLERTVATQRQLIADLVDAVANAPSVAGDRG